MTTGGSPKPVLKAVSRRLRPRNEETATHAPTGTPGMTLATLAVMEMKSDCRMMTHVSGSPVTNNKIAPTKPDPSSLQYSQFTAPILYLDLRSSVGQHLILGLAGSRNEQRSAVLGLPELADHLLSLGRKDIIGKCLAGDSIDLRKLCGIDGHHMVNVKERGIVLDEDREAQSLLEHEVGAAVGVRIALPRGCYLHRQPLALTGFEIPRLAFGIDPCPAPHRQLAHVR